MDVQAHWERIYSQKAADEVSWYRPHLETSLALIVQAASSPSASIIDVGGGESTLVDDLLARSYPDITVLDISQTACPLPFGSPAPAGKGLRGGQTTGPPRSSHQLVFFSTGMPGRCCVFGSSSLPLRTCAWPG